MLFGTQPQDREPRLVMPPKGKQKVMDTKATELCDPVLGLSVSLKYTLVGFYCCRLFCWLSLFISTCNYIVQLLEKMGFDSKLNKRNLHEIIISTIFTLVKLLYHWQAFSRYLLLVAATNFNWLDSGGYLVSVWFKCLQNRQKN